MRWNGMMDGWWWVWGLLWLVVLLALVALLIAAVVWIVRSVSSDARRDGTGPGAGGEARQILDARYARGELGREEYLQARRDLGDPAD